MYKIFDYSCKQCSIVEERMVDADEEERVVCSCGAKMVKEIPAPYGRVVGSETPVKQ